MSIRLCRAVGPGLILLMMGALLASPASAQFNAGVKGGLSIANLTGDDAEDPDWRTGFAGGVFMTYAFTPSVSIQPEALFLVKGAKDSFVEDGDLVEGKFRLDYIEIPLLLRVESAMLVNRTTAYVLGGPSIAFNTKCSMTGALGNVSATFGCDELDLEIRDVDFNLLGGIGVGLALRDLNLFVEGRYHYGLTKLEDIDDADDVRNQAFSVLAGISMPFGGRPTRTVRR